jgi:hypothetical protein
MEAHGRSDTEAFTVAADHGCRVFVWSPRHSDTSTANETFYAGLYAVLQRIQSRLHVSKTIACLAGLTVHRRYVTLQWQL